MLMRLVVLLGLAVCVHLTGFTSLSAQQFSVTPQTTTISYDAFTGVGSGQVRLFIREALSGPPHNVAGWSMSVGSDDSLLTPTDVEMGSYIETVNNGFPPGFWSTNIVSGGVTAGAVYDLFGQAICTYEVPKEVLVVSYSTVASAVAGDSIGVTTLLTSASLGSPAVSTVIVVAGASLPLTFVEGIVSLAPGGRFIRGDANSDGGVDAIPDAVSLLASLFGGEIVPLQCIAAGDVNNDGVVNIADPIALVSWGFDGGPAPSMPFPACGLPAAPPPLSCDLSACP